MYHINYKKHCAAEARSSLRFQKSFGGHTALVCLNSNPFLQSTASLHSYLPPSNQQGWIEPCFFDNPFPWYVHHNTKEIIDHYFP